MTSIYPGRLLTSACRARSWRRLASSACSPAASSSPRWGRPRPRCSPRAHQYNILLQMSDLTTLLTTYAANSGNVGIKLSRSSVRNLFFICRAMANLLGWKSGVLGSLASLSWQWTQLAQRSSKWGGHQESGDEPLYRVPHHQERGPRPQEAQPPLAGQRGEPLAHHLGQPTTNQRGALWSRDPGSSNKSSPGDSWPCSCC